VGAGTNLIYPFDKYWSLIAIANYTWLLKDAANSPLVEI